MRIVIIGPPASGKSTLTDHLVAGDPRLRTFGVRRHFARQIELGTPLGRAAEAVVRANGWIPDEIVAAAVREEIEAGGLGDAFILEGMPGNRRQAQLLDDVLAAAGQPLDAALHVSTPPEVCLARAARRLVCPRCDGGSHQAVRDPGGNCAGCGGPVVRRETDAPRRFADRLAQHAALAVELVGYYRGGRLVQIDGGAGLADMLAECDRRLAPMLAGAQ